MPTAAALLRAGCFFAGLASFLPCKSTTAESKAQQVSSMQPDTHTVYGHGATEQQSASKNGRPVATCIVCQPCLPSLVLITSRISRPGVSCVTPLLDCVEFHPLQLLPPNRSHPVDFEGHPDCFPNNHAINSPHSSLFLLIAHWQLIGGRTGLEHGPFFSHLALWSTEKNQAICQLCAFPFHPAASSPPPRRPVVS